MPKNKFVGVDYVYLTEDSIATVRAKSKIENGRQTTTTKTTYHPRTIKNLAMAKEIWGNIPYRKNN